MFSSRLLLSSFVTLTFSILSIAEPTHSSGSLSSSSVRPPTSSDLNGLEAHVLSKATDKQKCTYMYLKSLGWSMKASDIDSYNVHAGNPCDNDTLADSQRSGELTISISMKIDDSKIQDLLSELEGLSTGDASKCAYKFKVGKAAERAAQKLDSNKNFDFGFDSNAEVAVLPKISSRHFKTSGGCKVAKSSPSEAIRCFYEDSCTSECAVGLQVASMATQYELYGEKDFSRAFKNPEVAFGNWWAVQNSENPIEMDITKAGPESQGFYDKGHIAFTGVRGYIGNLRGESYLDNPNDRGENYIIVSTSQAAIDQAKKWGGIAGAEETNVLIWAYLTSDVRARNEYLKTHGYNLSDRELAEKAEAALRSPFYNDVKVFVHPLGIMTFGDHLRRLARKNPRTPYNIQFYGDNLMGSMYTRYRNFQVDACVGLTP